MLTTLDTSLLIPRQQPGGSGANPAQTCDAQRNRYGASLLTTKHSTPVPLCASNEEGPVFTIPELMDILEDRPEIREALRQSLIESKRKGFGFGDSPQTQEHSAPIPSQKKKEEENRDAQQHQ